MTVNGTPYPDLITDTPGSSREIDGGLGSDTLFGSDGDDTLRGGGTGSGDGAADSLVGGTGDDVYHVAQGDLVDESGGGGNDTVYAIGSYSLAAADAAGVENLFVTGSATGNALDNYIVTTGVGSPANVSHYGFLSLDGGAGNDTLVGGDGTDVLVGGVGEDLMLGGEGDDTYDIGTDRNDIVEDTGVTGIDTLRLKPTEEDVTVFLDDYTGVENAVVSGPIGARIVGTIQDNTLTGTYGDDTLAGGDGDDSLVGNDYGDLLLGDAGDDTLVGGTTDSTFVNELRGGTGNDVYHATAYDRIVEFAGEGEDILFCSATTVTMADHIEIALPELTSITRQVIGNAQSNRIWASGINSGVELSGLGGNDLLFGREATDTLDGGDGNDQLNGGGAADRLFGGAGDDTLLGEAGANTLTGGAGRDLFGVEAWMSGVHSTITDFVSGEDRIAINIAVASGGLTTDMFTVGAAATTAAHRVIYNPLNGGLYVDADGSGSQAAVLVVTVQGNAPVFTDIASLPPAWATGQYGTDADDVFRALAGDAFFFAYGGNDTLLGGFGDDYLAGARGDDIVQGDAGANTLAGGDGNDTLSAGNGMSTDELHGDANDDSLLGDGNDRLYGGEGDDTIEAHGAGNTLSGGAGNDIYLVHGESLAVELAGEGEDTVAAAIDWILGDDFEQLHLLDGAITGTGNGLGNTLFGNRSANVLLGAGGDDRLSGYSGGDALFGDAGNDTLSGGDDADTLHGGSGDDSLRGDGGSNHLSGDEGNDQLFAGSLSLADSLLGGMGDDTLTADGYDSLQGGDDNDTLIALGNKNALFGENGDDHLLGGSLDSSLYGGAGNDLLQSATTDLLAGNTGDDTYFVSGSAVRVQELAGEGRDSVVASVDWTLGVNLEALELAGAARNGSGNAQDNALLGNALDNRLGGGAGADLLDGAAGDDTLSGDAGDDTLQGAAGNDLLQGGNGRNLVFGDAGNDTLQAGGNDTLAGGAGDDLYIAVQPARLVEDIDGGIDRVEASANWTLASNIEALTLVGAATAGTGNGGNNTISGNDLANRLVGFSGDDTLDGGALNDTLNGGQGNDVLDGGAGADRLEGRLGNDTYYVNQTDDDPRESVGEGVDTVISSVTWTLGRQFENLTLVGSALNGNGSTANNVITGNLQANRLRGDAGFDTLVGGAGADTLDGGVGNDRLDGGEGNDRFLFDSAPNGANNCDTIAVFDVGQDRILLEDARYTTLTRGSLAEAAFVQGTRALDEDDRILYDHDTGNLYYDADGSGLIAKVKFAIIENQAALTAADFQIV